MKWIVFVLALANAAVYLFSLKLAPSEGKLVDIHQAETINPTQMSVVMPDNTIDQNQGPRESAAVVVEEKTLTQLKVDQQGRVLRQSNTQELPTAKKGAAGLPDIVVKPVEEMDGVILASTNKTQNTSKPVDNFISKPATVELAPKPKTSQLNESKAAETKPLDVADAASVCFRMGPFTNQNNLAAVRRQFEVQDISYKLDGANTPNKVKSVRVYLGAFADSAALIEQKKRLEEMKVDHFVIRINGTSLLQLGNFSDPARAKIYLLRLKKRGLAAKQEAIYHNTVIKSWLNIANTAKHDVTAAMLAAKVKVPVKTCP